jgi:hypothetical protein
MRDARSEKWKQSRVVRSENVQAGLHPSARLSRLPASASGLSQPQASATTGTNSRARAPGDRFFNSKAFTQIFDSSIFSTQLATPKLAQIAPSLF